MYNYIFSNIVFTYLIVWFESGFFLERLKIYPKQFQEKETQILLLFLNNAYSIAKP